ncbi:MAG TPA: putative porin, partial [Candidatus Didemnitutus sp.]|nr:putative porin [Candidatus Didemnitutus sp.]
MLNLKSKLFATAAALLCAGAAFAQDSGALIDLLVKKGVLNDQEAEELRAELTKDFAANTSAGKLNLSTPMTEFRIAGDVRVRYEDRRAEVAGDDVDRQRFRYRLRAGLYGKMLNNWNWGVRLETATGSRSSNVTMGDDAAGPFAKNSDGLFVGQVFIQYTPTPEWTFTTGRMPNPLVTTAMVWDADINPEGFA